MQGIAHQGQSALERAKQAASEPWINTRKWQTEAYGRLNAEQRREIRVMAGPQAESRAMQRDEVRSYYRSECRETCPFSLTILAGLTLAVVGIVLMVRKASDSQLLAGKIMAGLSVGVAIGVGIWGCNREKRQRAVEREQEADTERFFALMGEPPERAMRIPRLLPGVLDQVHDGQAPI
jgi:hypothetical protein